MTPAAHWCEAHYDREAREWVGQCPHGDVCTGCDALGYCTREEDADVIVSVFSERDVFIIRYRFGSLRSAMSFLSAYLPPEGAYTEMEV